MSILGATPQPAGFLQLGITDQVSWLSSPVLRNILLLIMVGSMVALYSLSGQNGLLPHVLLWVLLGAPLLLALCSIAARGRRQKGTLTIEPQQCTLLLKRRRLTIPVGQVAKVVLNVQPDAGHAPRIQAWGSRVEIRIADQVQSFYLAPVSQAAAGLLLSYGIRVVQRDLPWFMEPTGKLFSEMLRVVWLGIRVYVEGQA